MHADVERATHPEDLSRLIVERLNAGDVDGLVALYEPDAVLALPDGQIATGSEEIRWAAPIPGSSSASTDRPASAVCA
jgi:ketosteroid isomerase-like protein